MAAVAYYETLLEKPVVASELTMTQRSICTHRSQAPDVPLRISRSLGQLRLPWDCFPNSWKTPLDLALEARLEENILNGWLTTETLTGTLSMLAKSWDDAQYKYRCVPPVVRDAPSRQPPLLAASDGWSSTRRR